MRVLLDNCVPLRLRDVLTGHAVKHAAELGWEELKNGALLAKAATEFDLLLTTDQNIRYQQNLSKLPIPVLENDTRDSRFEALGPMAAGILAAIEMSRTHRFVSLKEDGTIETLFERIGPGDAGQTNGRGSTGQPT